MAINAVRYYFGIIETNIMPVKHIFLFLSIAFLLTAVTAQAQISPATAILGPSQPQQFTLAPSFQQQSSSSQLSSGPAANWMVVPASDGTISATGLFTAASSIPVATTARVYAQSGSILYEAKVQLYPEAASSTGPVNPPSVPVSISVSPTFVYLYAGQTQQFVASVSGSADQQALWSITQGPGAISGGLYSAPLAVSVDTLVTISATSVADPTKSVSATILVGPAITNPTSPTGGGSSVTPAKASVASSGTQQFSVLNVPFDTAIAWSLSPEVGSISPSGLFTAPNSVPAAVIITVTAINSSTRMALGSAALNLQASPASSVSPATATVAPSGTELFSVLNLPSGASVTWSITPPVGSISASGVFTAPSSVSAAQTLTVTATNSSTLAVLGTASLTLDASPSVNPATSTVAPSGTKQFAVLNLPSGVGVTWSVSSISSGSISASGLYTALSYVAAQQTLTVTAKNSSTLATLGSASLTVDASPTPSVSPAAATIAPSGIQHFSVQNLPSGASVTWSISPASGSISAAGMYTAPSNVASQTTITVTAKNSSTVLGTASVTLDASPTPSVSPAAATVAPSGTKQFSVLNLPSGDSITWSISPASGSISSAGVYTAPSNVASQTTITVTAKSSSTVLGTASMTLEASPTPSVSPATATVAPSGTKQFSVLNLPSGDSVTWSISSAVGSISTSGLYTAPNSVASQTTITVTAKSSSTVLGTASITLQASPAPSVSPSTVTVAPSGTQQFTVQNLPSGDSVTWSISSAVGSISAAGLYTAPSSVASQTTITVTAKHSSTVLGTASITLQASPAPSVSPSTVTVAPSGTQQFTVQNLPSGVTATWSVSGSSGSISASGLYTAPATVAAQTAITVTAKNSSTNAVLGTASLTLQASPTSATIPLPVEVVGPNGFTSTSSFAIPTGTNLSGAQQLSMTIHGLRFDAQASVQVNNSGWLPISTANVTLLGNGAAFGGIGGGFHTLQMTMNLPAGTITAGNNTITFRFNGTEGRVSGFRVLAFNVQTAGGAALIPASTFVQTDPNTWQPPSSLASDISAGQTLFQTASLTVPTASGAASIHAHCSDCHAQDGRDLKYFNYSNNAIVTRSLFHGLSAAEGNQIASYIRSLDVPNPGRPWNPPYQPGPGLDEQPVTNWSAGAGLDSVLNSDADMVSALFPSGVQASFFSPTGVLSIRETQIALQLPDWNSWLPTIHPMDSFSDFTTSDFFLTYGAIRSKLIPGDATTYASTRPDFGQWFDAFANFYFPKEPHITSVLAANQAYSVVLWSMVKSWEINQEFQLEGMARTVFTNPRAESRAWISEFPFYTSPSQAHISDTLDAIDNGSENTFQYLSVEWYHMQLILDNSEYEEYGTGPITWQYIYGKIQDLGHYDSAAQAGLLTEWLTKAIQISNNGVGPNILNTGWNWQNADISRLVSPSFRFIWPDVSAATRTAIYSGMVQAWLTEVQQFTPQQFYAGGLNASYIPARGEPDSSGVAGDGDFADRVWYMIPQFRYYGVSQSLINQLAAWAKTIWPNANWSATTTATCVPDGSGTFARCSTE